MNWASICLGAFFSLVGSRSNSASGVHCHQSLCWRLFRALTGPHQTQGQWNATGFPLWCDLQSISTGKNRAFQKLLFCCALWNRIHIRISRKTCKTQHIVVLQGRVYHWWAMRVLYWCRTDMQACRENSFGSGWSSLLLLVGHRQQFWSTGNAEMCVMPRRLLEAQSPWL